MSAAELEKVTKAWPPISDAVEIEKRTDRSIQELRREIRSLLLLNDMIQTVRAIAVGLLFLSTFLLPARIMPDGGWRATALLVASWVAAGIVGAHPQWRRWSNAIRMLIEQEKAELMRQKMRFPVAAIQLSDHDRN
jgi:hypothetical protein